MGRILLCPTALAARHRPPSPDPGERTRAEGEIIELLAHAGAGSTWQAMVTVVALGFVLVMLLVALGWLELDSPGDLVLPVAGVAILTSLAPIGDDWLSDWIGWAFPVGVVALVALVLAALTPLRLALDGVLLYAALGVAALAAVLLYQPLTVAWHPPADFLPDPGDTAIEILEPADGAELEPGEITIGVRVENGSIGPGQVTVEEVPSDPTEQGVLELTVGGERVEVDLAGQCPATDPCEQVEVEVGLPAGEEIGLQVELLRGDGMPFSPPVLDRIEVDAG